MRLIKLTLALLVLGFVVAGVLAAAYEAPGLAVCALGGNVVSTSILLRITAREEVKC